MKKAFVACFFVVLMLLLPLSSAITTEKIVRQNNINESENEIPEFYITAAQKEALDSFINQNFNEEEKPVAHSLVDDVLSEDLRINFEEMSNALSDFYIYKPIPKDLIEDLIADWWNHEANTVLYDRLMGYIEDYWGVTENGIIENLFSTLLIKIIEYIQDRLGWAYDFYEEASSLFSRGVNLAVDLIQPTLIILWIYLVDVLNQVLEAPKVFYEAFLNFLQLNKEEFINTVMDYADGLAENVSAVIDLAISLVEDPELDTYLTDCKTFVNWLGSEPWTNPIRVTGSVLSLTLVPQEGIIVSCRGQTTTTDSNGEFDYYVDVNPDSESIPSNKSYGMHNCVITISNDEGEIRSTIKILSYCFSGGIVDWPPFLIKKGRSKDIGIRTYLFEKLDLLLERIQTFLSNFFRNIQPRLSF